MRSDLNNLLNPKCYQGNIDLKSLSIETCENLYRKLTLIREVEKNCNREELGNIGGPVHLSAGQEAIPVGVSEYLRSSDYIFGAHRSHSHILALGSSVRRLFAELLGRSTGLSKGYGGSMHLIDQSVGFMGSVPIVGGTISLAVGAGFAISQKKLDSVAISYLGDGASEEGVFHESLNLARINNLPVLFIVENNLFSSHMDIEKRQPSSFISRFADAHLINFEIVDGNNVIDVMDASKRLINVMRKQKGPCLIEAITYRWYGHVDWREDIDVGTNRCQESLKNWKLRCPIKRLRDSIIELNILTQNKLDEIRSEIIRDLNDDWNQAINDPFPKDNDLLKNVYY